MRYLASLGVSLHDKDKKGKTLLHHGAKSGWMTPDALAFLLEEGLGLEEVDAGWKTPMDYAQEMAQTARFGSLSTGSMGQDVNNATVTAETERDYIVFDIYHASDSPNRLRQAEHRVKLLLN